MYGHIRYIYTVLANSTKDALAVACTAVLPHVLSVTTGARECMRACQNRSRRREHEM
jgi:hypothetical protein